MKLALCNEVLSELEFQRQCEYAAALGYQGLELAPFTLGDSPHLLAPRDRARFRRAAESAGLDIVGLHWLLVTPAGLSITSRDEQILKRTRTVMGGLVELCSDLGGRVLVHGSPAQRQVEPDDDPSEAWKRARAQFESIVPLAEAAGVVYCLEALPEPETNFINTIGEAAEMVNQIESPAFRTMLDTKAASLAEDRPVEEVAEKWFPTGLLKHVHLNDRNRRGPGQGNDRFAPLLSALQRLGYDGYMSVEPFDYVPDGKGVAAHSIGYIRGLLEN